MFPNLPENIIEELNSPWSELKKLIQGIKSTLEKAKVWESDKDTWAILENLLNLSNRFETQLETDKDRVVLVMLKICYLYQVLSEKVKVRGELTGIDLSIIRKEIQESIPWKVTIIERDELLVFIQKKRKMKITQVEPEVSIEPLRVATFIDTTIFIF